MEFYQLDSWYVFDIPYGHRLSHMVPRLVEYRLRKEVIDWLDQYAPGKYRISYAGVASMSKVSRLRLRNRNLAIQFKLVWG